jgi:hypothetical protein
MTANVEITADRVSNVLRVDYDATRFQPPKEIQEAMRAEFQRENPGAPGAPGGPAGPGTFQMQAGPGGPGGPNNRGPGGPNGMQQQFHEMLKSAGVDDARAQKIMDEMQAEMQKAMASMQQPTQQPQQGVIVAGPGFGPPQSMIQQQQRQERMQKIQQVQEAVFRRNLNEQEYAVVAKARVEQQSQKRVTVYKINDKGELERHQLVIGLSDSDNAQIVRGAEEGDKFVVRATPTGSGQNKP